MYAIRSYYEQGCCCLHQRVSRIGIDLEIRLRFVPGDRLQLAVGTGLHDLCKAVPDPERILFQIRWKIG